jgi:hypothetical protein
MSLVCVGDYGWPEGWAAALGSESRSRYYCDRLERGEILLFCEPPFSLNAADRDALIAQRASLSAVHKNISYRPRTGALGGIPRSDLGRQFLTDIMRRYSAAVERFVADFLRPYAGRYALDYASFRPIEEAGRQLPINKRNDLLHVDAFPNRPTRGARILRVFTNISREQDRVWMTGESFAELAEKHAAAAGLNRCFSPGRQLAAKATHWLHQLRLPVPDRSPYDRFMLRFHDYLKGNASYQALPGKTRTEFPPMATWMVFTDCVPHAVLSGQHALEQTFIVPVEALVSPEVSPLRTLERLCGRCLAPAKQEIGSRAA